MDAYICVSLKNFHDIPSSAFYLETMQLYLWILKKNKNCAQQLIEQDKGMSGKKLPSSLVIVCKEKEKLIKVRTFVHMNTSEG